jgi:hypothetical protein
MSPKALYDAHAAAAKREQSALTSVGASDSKKDKRPVASGGGGCFIRTLSHSAINVDDHGQLLRGTCNKAKKQVRLQSVTELGWAHRAWRIIVRSRRRERTVVRMWNSSSHSARSTRARVTQAAANFVEHDAPAARGCLPNLDDLVDDCVFDCKAQTDDDEEKDEDPLCFDFL